MNLAEIRRRLGEVREGLRHLAAQETLDEQRAAEFDWLEAEDRYLTEREAELEAEEQRATEREARREELRTAYGRPGAVQPGDGNVGQVNVNRGVDPFDLSGIPAYGEARNREVRSRALTAVERSTRFIEDRHKEQLTKVLQRVGHKDHLAEFVLLGSSEAYADGFLRSLTGATSGVPADLSEEERNALRQRHTLARAMQLSDVTGVLIPTHLDPDLILTSDGRINPFREVCRVETGVTNVFQSVTTPGASHSWKAEGAEVDDNSPSFSNPTATAFKGTVFIPISFEAYEDARGREDEIMMVVRDEIDDAEATAFVSGNGTSRPRGLVTALDANTNVEVANTTSNVFGLADVYNVYEQLPPRWRNARTTWFANLSVINDVRQFGTDNYNTQTVQLGARNVPAILGHPVVEASEMDSEVTTGSTDNILVVGDPQKYLIYDRLGTSIEFVPNLFGTTNGRPTGERGWLAHHRTGANTTVDTAFRLLQTETN